MNEADWGLVINTTLFVVLVIIMAVLFVHAFIMGDSSGTSSVKGALPMNRKEIAPVIGYKRGNLRLTTDDARFSGVLGHPYGLESTAIPNSPGFHMYSSLLKAVQHPQYGNVLLEVIGSGQVDEYDSGWITNHQRVLQIIFPSCAILDCNRQSVALSHADAVYADTFPICQTHITFMYARGEVIRRNAFTYMHELTSDRLVDSYWLLWSFATCYT